VIAAIGLLVAIVAVLVNTWKKFDAGEQLKKA
jgi:hypothetical protein